MNNKKALGGLTARQAGAVCFVGLLPPATRLLPGLCARLAGRAAWLCPIAALPVLLIVAWLMKKLTANAVEGENLAGLIRRGLGRWAGGAVLIVYGLWLVAYAGFSLRSSASRFIYTIYPGAPPWPFVIAGLVMGLFAVLAPVKALARASELFRSLLLLALIPILGFGLAQLDWDELLPVSRLDIPGVLEGGVYVLGTVSFVLVNVPFLETGTPIEHRGRSFAAWSARECLFLAVIVAAVIGRFGPELTGTFTYPFFALVRNTGLFGDAIRIEALVTGLWVLSDFVLAGFALMSAVAALRLSLGLREKPSAAKCLSARTLTTLACAALALACALVIAPNARAMRIVSDQVVVCANLAMLGLMLLTLTAQITVKRRRG